MPNNAVQRRTRRVIDGVPVLGWDRTPGRPPVAVSRVADGEAWDLPAHGPHAHDFLLVLYAVRADGAIRVDGRAWTVSDGDVVVIAPGQVVAATGTTSALSEAWAVLFPADALGAVSSSWRSHPLLFPFARGVAQRAQRLRVPPAERAAWHDRFVALAAELATPGVGAQEAALAHLALLLVGLARLSGPPDAAGHDAVLGAVGDVIDARYDAPLSLVDVAAAVGLSPNHLTAVVRRRTGRTVLEWITDRRMDAARRLLAETDLPVAAVGRRVGFSDDGYFIRRFRREHDRTPGRWRREHRTSLVP